MSERHEDSDEAHASEVADTFLRNERHVDGESDQNGHDSSLKDHGYDVCKNLVTDLDPEYRRRYLSGNNSAETKKHTKLVQDLILSMVRRGPIRDSMVEMAAKRSQTNMGRSCEEQVDMSRDDIPPGCRSLHSSTQITDMFEEVRDLFTIANDDDSFVILSMLFDEDLQDNFEAIAGPYMEMYRARNHLNLTTIMRDVLKHAQWKCFGVQNTYEHKKRELALLCLSGVVGKAREAYGLTPYSTIRDRFT